MNNFPQEYKLPENQFQKLRFNSLVTGDKKDGTGKWFKINVTGQNGEVRFFWSTAKVNQKIQELGVNPGDTFMIKKTGFNDYLVQFEGKEHECLEEKTYKGSGGAKRNWVSYTPQDIKVLMQWCKNDGGEDWRELLQACVTARAIRLSVIKEPESTPESSVKSETEDDNLPF